MKPKYSSHQIEGFSQSIKGDNNNLEYNVFSFPLNISNNKHVLSLLYKIGKIMENKSSNEKKGECNNAPKYTQHAQNITNINNNSDGEIFITGDEDLNALKAENRQLKRLVDKLDAEVKDLKAILNLLK